MTDSETKSAPAPDDGPLSPAGVKALKFAVVGMGVLILVGLAVVVGRIIYLASTPKAARHIPASQIVASSKLSLPAGAVAKQVTLNGNRLSVLYEAPAQTGIKILDLRSGKQISHIILAPHSK